MIRRHSKFTFLWVILPCIALSWACAQSDRSLRETQSALSQQATLIKLKSEEELEPTIVVQNLELTQKAKQLTIQQTQAAEQSMRLTSVYQQWIEAQQFITVTIPPVPSVPSPLPTPTSTRVIDMKKEIFSAKILLFEDMAGVYNTQRYVKEALDELGLSYTDTKDMLGEFKKQLMNKAADGKNWDLIIAADESRSIHNSIKGEFFTLFLQSLEGGGAVILETWNLDTIKDKEVTDLLDKCGLAYQGDLYDLRNELQIFYTPNPDHPVLTEPNRVELFKVMNYWDLKGDMGDVLKANSSGKATILFSRKPDTPTAYGTLATCFGGRFIIQTFSSHQYAKDQMIALWQNYIYQTLKNHFLLAP